MHNRMVIKYLEAGWDLHHKPWIIINIICPQILLDDAFLIYARNNWQIQEVDFTYGGQKLKKIKNKLKLISLKPIMGDGHADEKPPTYWRLRRRQKSRRWGDPASASAR